MYFFSRSIGPLQCLVNANYRVLICCTCHFQSGSLFFFFFFLILASSFCKSLQCPISSLTQAGEGGHLFRLTCSVALWGGGDTANKYHWHLWGVITVYRPHCVCPSPLRHVLSWSTLLRLQVALLVYYPKWTLCFMHFPGLSHSGSGSRVLHKGKDLFGHAFCAFPRSKKLK